MAKSIRELTPPEILALAIQSEERETAAFITTSPSACAATIPKPPGRC